MEDFENKLDKELNSIKEEILKGINNPHQKDLVNAGLTAKQILLSPQIWGHIGVFLAFKGAIIIELADHIFCALCYSYIIISLIDPYMTYTSFRALWQNYSIPAKNALINKSKEFFKSQK